jgi:hypothetical protein
MHPLIAGLVRVISQNEVSMKAQITGMLISLSVLAASVSLAAAQQNQPSQGTIVVGSGNDLRCRLEKGLRITKAGEPITARLVAPVYVGTVLAIPEGAVVKGHVALISTASLSRRKRRILSGDFTPPKTANVTFDEIVLSDGTSIPIHTDATVGINDMVTVKYLPKSQRPGIREKVKGALKPLREPNKLQRLSQAVITSLPYHPEYLSQGTVFDAIVLDQFTTAMPMQLTENIAGLPVFNYLRLRLLTPLNSQTIERGAFIEATVSQPYYNSDGTLLYPAGTKLEGSVTKATAAGWMRKGGGLLFSFHTAETPDGTITDVKATVAGIEAPGGQGLTVGKEGETKTTTSLFSRLRAPVSLIAPSRAAADSTLNKTAWSRATEGRNGFGLLGAGAAQASAATATGFGYFGGAMKMYDAFLAKGSNVDLPVNTPIFLLMSEGSRPATNVISQNPQ